MILEDVICLGEVALVCSWVPVKEENKKMMEGEREREFGTKRGGQGEEKNLSV